MKAIMISDKPKWCALMMNGDKTIEVRKESVGKAIQKLIDEQGFADIYVYCSKDGGNLVYGTEYRGGNFVDEYGITRGYSKQKANEIFGLLNGKVLFKFRCYKVIPIVMQMGADYGYGNNGYIGYGHCEKDNFKFMFDMEKETCLEHNEELCKYLNNGKNFDDIYINKLKAKNGYAIHISDLEIFDKPKELSEFEHIVVKQNYDSYGCKSYKEYMKKPLTKAPQNMCYIEIEDSTHI